MKLTLLLLNAALILAACGDVGDAPQAQTGEALAVESNGGDRFVIDTTQSTINWRAAKVTRAHDGGFRTFAGTVAVSDGQAVGLDVDIETQSIWSDTERLTGHLKSEDFFAVETYPTAKFVSDQITPVDSTGATHLVSGNLAMHGETRGVTFPATIDVQEGTLHATADFIIIRTDWNINYTGQADDLIEHEVRLILDITAMPETAPSDEVIDEPVE